MVDEPQGEAWILYVGSYPPRECGIATFTKDLTSAIHSKSSALKRKICAMNRNSVNMYNYSPDVIFQLDDSNIQEYLDVAKKINATSEIKLVSIQHEFGLFGGQYGSYLIPFLELLDKPVTVTFHSVLPDPDEILQNVVRSISQKVKSIVVMTPKGVDILRNDYGIETDIVVIPHGIPSVQYTSSLEEKKRFGFQDKIILSSFGLISSGKGYEFMIDALPDIVKKFPNVMYLILGETHPVVRNNEGEIYRNFLAQKVKELGMQQHVKFYNKYLTLDEIIDYLKATDIYISSSLEPRQITSGTLAYAMGCGRAVVSTPFLHAQDLVNDERGLLTEFRDVGSFSKAVNHIISENLSESMGKNSYIHTRHMTWSNVALSYLDLFRNHIHVAAERVSPNISLHHMEQLTDDFGIIQFAKMSKPDLMSGYTLDDNARALLVACMSHQSFQKSQLLSIEKYLSFINYVQQEDGKLYNYVNDQRVVNMQHWTDDAHGRAMWSLGYLLSVPSLPVITRDKAAEIFVKALDVADKITSPRAVASIIIGLYYANTVQENSDYINRVRKFADHLVSLFNDSSSPEWNWFESSFSYANSKLSEALFYAYEVTHDEKYLRVAETTLHFLESITFENGMFHAIGQNGWYLKNGRKSYYDQQPICTAAMVQTMVVAYHITKKEKYSKLAHVAFDWFFGNNVLRQMIYNESTGGCHDGLGEFSINLNQGAESTISYLIARLTIEEIGSGARSSLSLNGPAHISSREILPRSSVVGSMQGNE
jgi:glycosyltransferase involved in cell wall biosynthesis